MLTTVLGQLVLGDLFDVELLREDVVFYEAFCWRLWGLHDTMHDILEGFTFGFQVLMTAVFRGTNGGSAGAGR